MNYYKPFLHQTPLSECAHHGKTVKILSWQENLFIFSLQFCYDF